MSVTRALYLALELCKVMRAYIDFCRSGRSAVSSRACERRLTWSSAGSSAGSSAWTNASGGRAGRRGAADFGGAADRQAEGYKKSRRRPRAGTPSQHDASACRQQPSSGVGRR